MYNDTDERRRYDQGGRRARYQEPEAHGESYAEEQQHAEYDDQHGAYAEDDGGHHARYEAEHDPASYDEPPRRSRLVPILSIVAALLVVVIGVGAALYFLGVFGGSDRPVANAVAPTGDDTAIPPAPGTGDVRSVGPSVTPDTTAAEPGTETNPSVPDAVV
ncbi:MAG: hypothetical protein J0H08_17455, partial [Rhizobiales bacterium]|nr:hypothetical protein [Hyphomicrobiales bacterium]